MLLRRALLERLPVCPPAWGEDEPLAFRCDDIYLSMCLGLGCADGEAPHLLPGALRGHWQKLPDHGAALEAQRGHWQKRHRAVLRLREWLKNREDNVPLTKEVV